MKKTNALKSHLEKLINEEENQYCFDCGNKNYYTKLGKKPAHWASINNGIYLCFNCSGEHRGLGVSISYIRSVTLDAFNENQVKMMSYGGNGRLASFITKCGVSRSIPIKQFYNSKIMHFYRRMLKAFANDEPFDESLPDENEMMDSYTSDQSYPSFNNKMININDDRYNKNKSTSNLSNTSKRWEPSNRYSSSDADGNLENKMITINDDHYAKTKNFSDMRNEGSKFESVSSKYSNDSRFASISSEPLENYTDVNEGYSSSSSRIYSFLGSAYDITKTVAGALKEKVSEMELGSKLVYTGEKTVEVLKYTGSKVIEKGSDIAQSETVQNLSQKASDGFSYVVGKFFGSKPNNSGNDNNNYNSSRYSGVSSDYDNNYSQMAENKNEKFIYNRDRDYN